MPAAMDEPDPPLLISDARSGWVRLRTLILLRWLAVLGQTAAVLVAVLGLGMRLPYLEVALVIGALAAFNLAAMAIAARNRRLSEGEALATLLFDLAQLGALLRLTGGIENPFALLIIAPVTIGASVLSLRATAILAAAAGAIITLLAVFRGPIELASGEILAKVEPGKRVLVPGPHGLMQSATVRQLLSGYYELEVGASGETIWVPMAHVVPE